MGNMSTFHDYCLTCDRQLETSEDVYCSQQCRLAELCTSPSASNVSLPPTPTVSRNPENSSTHSRRRGPSSSVSSSSSTQSNSRSGANAFVLPPAYDFSSHRHSTISNSSTSSTSSLPTNQRYSSTTATRPPSGYFSYAGSGAMLLSSSEAAKKTLSPTSSRSSITSNGDELRAYESGFDVTRDWRRRRASVYDAAWQRY